MMWLKNNFIEEQERWFAAVPAVFGAGIALYFFLPFEPSLWMTLAFIELLVLAAYFCRFNNNMLLVLAALAIFILGFSNAQLQAFRTAKHYQTYNIGKTYLKGKVKAVDYSRSGKPRLTLENPQDFDENVLKGKVMITLLARETNVKPGDCVELAADVKEPLKTLVVGGYQFSRKYFFENVSASGFALSRAVKVQCAESSGWREKFDFGVQGLRRKIALKIKAVLPADEASVTSAIVAGDKNAINEKLFEQYRDSGLAHFLSISGLHMSMIAGLMFFLVRFALVLIPPISLRCDTKKIAAVLAFLMSAFYLLISGAEIPAERAFIMTSIVLLGVLVSRRAISMQNIAWAALVILIFYPEALVGASFQMSFAAVVCLIAFYEKYAGALHRFLNRGGFLRIVFVYVGGILASDLVASLATLPFCVYHFNRISVYTTLGNLLAGPVIGLIIMPFVLLSMILMPLGLEAWALKITGFGVNLVNKTTAWVAGMEGSSYQILSMPAWGLALIAVGGVWLCVWQKQWRRWGWVGIVLGALSVFATEVPDVMVNENGSLIAVKDNSGNMVILPARGKSFEKKIWLEKFASRALSAEEADRLKEIYKGEKIDKNWLDLECFDPTQPPLKKGGVKVVCFYKGIILQDLPKGASIWIEKGGLRVESVDGYVGKRYWNR